MSSKNAPIRRLYRPTTTTMPPVFHSTYDRWMEYIVNERAAARAVCALRRHVHFCELADTARSIQDRRKQ